MGLRSRVTTSILSGTLLLLVAIGLSGCGSDGAADRAAAPSDAATGAVGADSSTNTSVANAASIQDGPFRTVLSPYHNPYGDVTGVYVDTLSLEVDPKVEATVFPSVVPAYLAELRTLPSTDLDFTSMRPLQPDIVSPYLWRDPEAETLLAGRETMDESDRSPLHGTAVALQQAESFLAEHGLAQPDLLSGEVAEGSSVSGSIKIVSSWNVCFSQEPSPEVGAVFAGPLPGAVSVRVGPFDRPIQISWSLLDLTQDGSLRLRPLADVLADQDAWRDGSVSPEVNSWLEPDLHLAVTGVTLGLARVTSPPVDDLAARYLVPVYQFAVEPIALDGSRGTAGVWTVVAAQDADH
jgi:hypothetical protein